MRKKNIKTSPFCQQKKRKIITPELAQRIYMMRKANKSYAFIASKMKVADTSIRKAIHQHAIANDLPSLIKQRNIPKKLKKSLVLTKPKIKVLGCGLTKPSKKQVNAVLKAGMIIEEFDVTDKNKIKRILDILLD